MASHTTGNRGVKTERIVFVELKASRLGELGFSRLLHQTVNTVWKRLVHTRQFHCDRSRRTTGINNSRTSEIRIQFNCPAVFQRHQQFFILIFQTERRCGVFSVCVYVCV